MTRLLIIFALLIFLDGKMIYPLAKFPQSQTITSHHIYVLSKVIWATCLLILTLICILEWIFSLQILGCERIRVCADACM